MSPQGAALAHKANAPAEPRGIAGSQGGHALMEGTKECHFHSKQTKHQHAQDGWSRPQLKQGLPKTTKSMRTDVISSLSKQL